MTTAGPRRIILDTDVGTDVDDLWTLALVGGRPDAELEAVTVVYGDTALRGRLASMALAGMGIDAPVVRGIGTPMSGKDVLWAGFEGVGIEGLDDVDPGPTGAPAHIARTVAAAPGLVEVVAIGPLTNIAAALVDHPAAAGDIGHLTLMGGEFARGWPEHNVSADVVATSIVLGSGVPTTIVPLDQTLRVFLSADDLQPVVDAHTLGPLLADQARRFWDWLATVIPSAPSDASPAHDPATLLAVLEPDLFELTPMVVTIDDAGRTTSVPDADSIIRVVTDLDPDRVRATILAALAA